MSAVQFASFVPSKNDSSQREQNENLEKIEVELRKEYHDGLRLQKNEDHEGARTTFSDILKHECFNQEKKLRPTYGLRTLRFMTLKNLAVTLEKLELPSLALDALGSCCTMMVTLNMVDPLLYYHGARLAVLCNKMTLARYFLEQGVLVEEQSWVCANLLIDVLYLINDVKACQSLCQTLLQIPNCSLHDKATALVGNNVVGVKRKADHWRAYFTGLTPQSIHASTPKPKEWISFPVAENEQPTWSALVELLITELTAALDGKRDGSNVFFDVPVALLLQHVDKKARAPQQSPVKRKKVSNSTSAHAHTFLVTMRDHMERSVVNEKKESGAIHSPTQAAVSGSSENTSKDVISFVASQNDLDVGVVQVCESLIYVLCGKVLLTQCNATVKGPSPVDVGAVALLVELLLVLSPKSLSVLSDRPCCALLVTEIAYFLHNNAQLTRPHPHLPQSTWLKRTQRFMSVMLASNTAKIWLGQHVPDRDGEQLCCENGNFYAERFNWLFARFEFSCQNFCAAKILFESMMETMKEEDNIILSLPYQNQSYNYVSIKNMKVYMTYMDQLEQIEATCTAVEKHANQEVSQMQLTVLTEAINLEYFALVPMDLQARIVSNFKRANVNSGTVVTAFYWNCKELGLVTVDVTEKKALEKLNELSTSISTFLFNHLTVSDVKHEATISPVLLRGLINAAYDKIVALDFVDEQKTPFRFTQMYALSQVVAIGLMAMITASYTAHEDLHGQPTNEMTFPMTQMERMELFDTAHAFLSDAGCCQSLRGKSQALKPIALVLLSKVLNMSQESSAALQRGLVVTGAYMSCCFGVLTDVLCNCRVLSSVHGAPAILEYRRDWSLSCLIFDFVKLVQDSHNLSQHIIDRHRLTRDEDINNEEATEMLNKCVAQFLAEMEKSVFISRQLALERDRMKRFVEERTSMEVAVKWDDLMSVPITLEGSQTSATSSTQSPSIVDDDDDDDMLQVNLEFGDLDEGFESDEEDEENKKGVSFKGSKFNWAIFTRFMEARTCSSPSHDTMIQAMEGIIRHCAPLVQEGFKVHQVSTMYQHFFGRFVHCLESNFNDLLVSHSSGSWKNDDDRLVRDLVPLMEQMLLGALTVHFDGYWVKLGVLQWLNTTSLALVSSSSGQVGLVRGSVIHMDTVRECLHAVYKTQRCLRVALALCQDDSSRRDDMELAFLYAQSTLSYIIYLTSLVDKEYKRCGCTYTAMLDGIDTRMDELSVLATRMNLFEIASPSLSLSPNWIALFNQAELHWHYAEHRLRRWRVEENDSAVFIQQARQAMVLYRKVYSWIITQSDADDDDDLDRWRILISQRVGLLALYALSVIEHPDAIASPSTEELSHFFEVTQELCNSWKSKDVMVDEDDENERKWVYNGHLVQNYVTFDAHVLPPYAISQYPLSNEAQTLLMSVDALFIRVAEHESKGSEGSSDTKVDEDMCSFQTLYGLAAISLFARQHGRGDGLQLKHFAKNHARFVADHAKWKASLSPPEHPYATLLMFEPWHATSWHFDMLAIYFEQCITTLDAAGMCSFYDSILRRFLRSSSSTAMTSSQATYRANVNVMIMYAAHTARFLYQTLHRLLVRVVAEEKENSSDEDDGKTPIMNHEDLDVLLQLAGKACRCCMQLYVEDIDSITGPHAFSLDSGTATWPESTDTVPQIRQILSYIDIQRPDVAIDFLVMLAYGVSMLVSTLTDATALVADADLDTSILMKAVRWGNVQVFSRKLNLDSLLTRQSKWKLKTG